MMSVSYVTSFGGVEPNRSLNSEIMLSGATRVMRAAAGFESGRANFLPSFKDDASSFLSPSRRKSMTKIVPRVRLDTLNDYPPFNRIDLLRMDTERLEMEPLFEVRGDQLAKVIQ